MKYAIRVEETRGKTFIVEADSLENAIDKVDSAICIDLDNEDTDREVYASPYATDGGIATEYQLENCEFFEN